MLIDTTAYVYSTIPAFRGATAVKRIALILAGAVLLTAVTTTAEEDAFLRNEKRLSELERQLNLLRQENATLKRRVEVMSLPTTEAVNAYLEQRGLSGVGTADKTGKQLSEALERIRLSASLSTRYEYVENLTDLSNATRDTGDFLFTRLELGLFYDLNDNITIGTKLRGVFLGGGKFGINPPDPSNILNDSDTLDVYEAYVLFHDINMLGRLGGHIPVSIQIGRQEFFYGDGFVLGNDSFGRGISYDGIRFIQENGNHRVDIFWAKLTENDFISEAGMIVPGHIQLQDDDADILGLWTDMRGGMDMTVSAYAMLLQDWGDGLAHPFLTYPATLVTLGARLTGSVEQKLNYSMEAAAQVGSWEYRDVQDSFGVKGKVGYDGLGVRLRPFATFVVAYGSGDKNPLDTKENQFKPLAQDKHDLLGGLDLFQTTNLKAGGGEVGFHPLPELSLSARYYRYYANELADDAGGWLTGGGTGNYVGEEWNFGFGWDISVRSKLGLFYGEFYPGNFSTAQDTARRLYLTVDVAF
jgi:hypothetical protein